MSEILKKIYKYWMKFAHVLGTINGFIILFVFYFVIIGLYALPARLIRLFKKKNSNDTFWKEKEHPSEELENLKFQF